MRWATLLLALGAAPFPGAAQGIVWKEGDPLRDLRLPTIDGERTVDLSTLRGKKLLLVEFASW